MLERIIAQSIRFRWLVMAIVLISAVVGVWSFQRLPVDYGKVTRPIVKRLPNDCTPTLREGLHNPSRSG